MQDGASMRSSPSPIRSHTASAHEDEAAPSSFAQFDAQLRVHELALPVDEAGSADDQKDGTQKVSLSSDEEGKSSGL